jgi:hypothetical protein
MRVSFRRALWLKPPAWLAKLPNVLQLTQKMWVETVAPLLSCQLGKASAVAKILTIVSWCRKRRARLVCML